MMAFGRCDYCHEPAVVRFCWPSSFVSRGIRKGLTIYCKACAKHEGCSNWQSNRELHPTPIERAA